MGILAAYALPKFADLGSDAERAKLESLYAAINSAAKTVFLACQVASDCDETLVGQTVFIPAYNQDVEIRYGWPDAGDLSRTDQIDDLVDSSGFELSNNQGGQGVLWTIPGKEVCRIYYARAGSEGQTEPIIRKAFKDC